MGKLRFPRGASLLGASEACPVYPTEGLRPSREATPPVGRMVASLLNCGLFASLTTAQFRSFAPFKLRLKRGYAPYPRQSYALHEGLRPLRQGQALVGDLLSDEGLRPLRPIGRIGLRPTPSEPRRPLSGLRPWASSNPSGAWVGPPSVVVPLCLILRHFGDRCWGLRPSPLVPLHS